MAKKAQTTGLPKDKRKSPDTTQQGGKEPLTQAERDAQYQRLLVRVTIGVLILVVLLVGFALGYELIYRPNQVVASVNGENIVVRDFQDRVKFEQSRIYQALVNQITFLQSQGYDEQSALQLLQQQDTYGTWLNEINFPDQLGRRVLDDMVNDTLIRQEAEARDITVNDEEVDNAMNQYFGYDPTQTALIGADPTETAIPSETPVPFVSATPSLTPTATATATLMPEVTAEVTAEATAEATAFPTVPPAPTLSPEQVEDQYQENVDGFFNYMQSNADVGNSVIEGYFERLAIREALQEAITADIQNPLMHANVRHILVDDEETAQEIVDALNNGESFSELARALSKDTGSGVRGGELGWAPIQQYVEEFAAAVETAEIGVIVGPVETQFGFHIIQVRAREERDADENIIEQIKLGVFSQWLEAQRDSEDNTIEIYDTWVDNLP